MVEQIFSLSRGNEKAVEKVIFDENLHLVITPVSVHRSRPSVRHSAASAQ